MAPPLGIKVNPVLVTVAVCVLIAVDVHTDRAACGGSLAGLAEACAKVLQVTLDANSVIHEIRAIMHVGCMLRGVAENLAKLLLQVCRW